MPESRLTKIDLVRKWLPRYTGMELDRFGDYVLLTNFKNYLVKFADRFDCKVYGENKPMQAATNDNGLTMINFHMGSANAATIMDLLIARQPKTVLFFGEMWWPEKIDGDRSFYPSDCCHSGRGNFE